jgi:dienelactone hydrolase
MSILRPTRLLNICGLAFFMSVQSGVPCSADQLPAPAAKLIEFEGDLPFTPKPVILKGYLRRPDAAGRHPAIVLLHGCGGAAERLDQNWGRRLASSGYVTLTIDRTGDICSVKNFPPLQDFDAYRGLNFLARQSFVDAKRVVVMGLQQGGSLALYSVERGSIEQIYENKFRAAVALYPICDGLRGTMAAPALILIGERDPSTPGCRDMVEGRGGDFGSSRTPGEGAAVRLVVYPNAYHAFDVPKFKSPMEYLGYHLEYNQAAADQSLVDLREFLDTMVGSHR